MPAVFLFGTLRHAPLLRIVAGTEVPVRPARLPDHAVVCAKGEDYPMLLPQPGAMAQGLLADFPEPAFARADWYETAFGYALSPVEVVTEEGETTALAWKPDAPDADHDGPWTLEGWEPGWAGLSCEAADEAMSYHDRFPPEGLAWRFPMIQARAQSRLNAARMTAPSLAGDLSAASVEVEETKAYHAGYFLMRTTRLTHPTYGGGRSPVIEREVFVATDAALILPYDPARDRVLMVDQFRMGPFGRGDPFPWSLEPVAGRIDAGEDPLTCAVRECEEEARITPTHVEKVHKYYPSPGASSEYFHTFVGLCPLPDSAEGRGGLAEEHEDIRTHVLSFDAAMDLVSDGSIRNAPLILLLYWLERERPRLRGMA